MFILSILAVVACVATSIGVFFVAPRLTGKLKGIIPLVVWIGAEMLPILVLLAEGRALTATSVERYYHSHPGASALPLVGQLVSAVLGTVLLMNARSAQFRALAEGGDDRPLGGEPVTR